MCALIINSLPKPARFEESRDNLLPAASKRKKERKYHDKSSFASNILTSIEYETYE